MPTESASVCNAAGTLPRTVQGASMICAGYVDGEQGGCHGDSGGPLVIDVGNGHELIGVVSWGVGYYCSSYTVFSRVDAVSSWISGYVGTQPVFGDVNGDACIDQTDYDLLAASYNQSVANGANPNADFNLDGHVDYLDYLILSEHWGQGC